MRKNVKQQLALRVLSTAALVAMVSSIATAAFAAEYDVTKGSVDILAANGEQRITQWEDKDKDLCVKDDKGEIRNRLDDDITLTTKNETTDETKPTDETETTDKTKPIDETETTDKTKPTHNTVTIDAKEGNTANVTLDNVHIEVDPYDNTSGAIEIKGDGNTNLELNGDNTVLAQSWVGKEHAAIEKADKYGTGTLTIKDDVNDDGSKKTGTDADTTGKLLAGGYEDSAAIGGGAGEGLGDTSNITITGGEITAIGGYGGGSGIGGGGRYGGTGKNIRIEGNAHVTAYGSEGAAIGGGTTGGNSITITDDAVVDAYGTWGSAIGDGGLHYNVDSSATTIPTTAITISGNATVTAETSQRSSAIGAGQHGSSNNLTIDIKENAKVTAIGSMDTPAIGNRYCKRGTTTINITGGTVNAINSVGSNYRPDDGTGNYSPAIGADLSSTNSGTCNVNINSSTGDTVVNAYIYGKGSGPAIGSTILSYNNITHKSENQYVPADSASYKADGSSYFGERNSAIVNCYNNGSVNKEELELPDTKDSTAVSRFKYRHTIEGGTLTKVVHNRKYMEEHPEEIVDITKLEDEDLHDWKLVGEVVQPTLEKEGYADYICSIDKCGQTKHVVLPKLTPEPSEPDTPNKPDTPDTPDTPSTPDVPSTPEVTPADPAVTPDAPAQDGTAPADTLTADTTAAAQNVAQNAEPKAAAAAPVAALPQTGANWLAVVGTALSGLFLLAAGFVLDRKNRRMN